jgi:hypothetical protein
MISIYTRTNNPLKKEFWKWVAKKILRRYSGPDAVLDSLIRGLKELHIPFEINPRIPTYKIIHVLSGVEVLKEQITQKKTGQIIIAGPTLITTPFDHNKCINDPNIDIILTPSQWVSDFYVSLIPELKNKIYSWPAGVKIPTIKTDKSGKVILFKKNISHIVLEHVENMLNEQSIPYELLEYGNFTHDQYITKLEKAPYMIYLQTSESQGIALQEAWSYNVPTLVFQNTHWNFEKYSWSDPSISAPYLHRETGFFFTLSNLREKLQEIIQSDLQPKDYCKEHLSDKRSIEILFDILTKHNEKNH